MSLTTLLATAVASAATAVIVHSLWEPGTIPAAAATPVLLSVLTELLRRPTERLVEAARRRLGAHGPAASRTGQGWWARPRWGRALATGIAGFVIGATVLTAAELVLDRSVAGSAGGSTTFGGTRPSERTPAPTSAGDGSGSETDPDRPDASPSGTPEVSTPAPPSTPTPTATPGATSQPLPTPTP